MAELKAKLTKREVADIVAELSISVQPEGVEAKATPSLFCKGWPIARPVIESLGYTSNWLVKMAVTVVLQIGEALFAKCPHPK